MLPLEEGQLIEHVEYLEPELIPELPSLKRSIVDVHCTDNLGRYFIVEMQMYWTSAFKKRNKDLSEENLEIRLRLNEERLEREQAQKREKEAEKREKEAWKREKEKSRKLAKLLKESGKSVSEIQTETGLSEAEIDKL